MSQMGAERVLGVLDSVGDACKWVANAESQTRGFTSSALKFRWALLRAERINHTSCDQKHPQNLHLQKLANIKYSTLCVT